MATALHDPRGVRFLKRFAVVVLVLALLLVLLEIFLVPIVNWWLDKNVEKYRIEVEDVDLAPWRGAYAVDGVTVRLRESEAEHPMLAVDRIDTAIDGRALLKGSFVGSITVDEPVARYVVVKRGKKETVHGPDVALARLMRELLPLKVNRFVVHDGRVFFVTDVALPSGATRKLDLKITDIQVHGWNLTNSEKLSDTLFGTVHSTATVEGWGDVKADMRVQPVAALPTFDLDASVTKLPLTQLNDWSMAFGKFVFEAGTLDLYTEIAAKEGRFTGYIKPLAKGVETKAPHQDLGEKIIAGVVEGAAKLLKNRETKRTASRIPIKGTLSAEGGEVDPELLPALFSVFRNALLEAIRPIIDGTVSLGDASK